MAKALDKRTLDEIQAEIDRLNKQKDDLRDQLLKLVDRRKELLAFEQTVTKLAGAGIKPEELKEMGVSAEIQKAVEERRAARLPSHPPSQSAKPTPARVKGTVRK